MSETPTPAFRSGMLKRMPATLFLFSAVLALAACGGSSSSSFTAGTDTDSGTPGGGGGGGTGGGSLSGTFIDAATANLDFSTPTVTGMVTDASGGFSYNSGETVSFFIGSPNGIPLGSAPGADIITPVHLISAASNAEHRAVTNIVRLLLTLDQNGIPGDGSQIPEAARTAGSGVVLNFDQEPADFENDAAVQAYLDAVFPPSGRTLVSATAARDHLTASLSAALGTPVAADSTFNDVLNDAPFLSAASASDPQNDSLLFALRSNVTNGTLNLAADGTFTYTADTDFVGSDQFTFVVDDGTSDGITSNTGTVTLNVIAAAPGPFTRAVEITDPADLIGGPLARATVCDGTGPVGNPTACDVLLENDQIRVIIQREGRQWYNIGMYGGTIIDADLQRPDGEPGMDNFEEFFLGVNIETTANPTDVMVTNAGGTSGEIAEVCAMGEDDLHDFTNGSSAIRDLMFNFPESADDVNLPIDIETCYRLRPGVSYVEVETRMINQVGTDHDIYLTEWFSGSGEVELFQPGLGFGEPFVNPSCPANALQCSAEGDGCESCNWLSYSGHDGATGVSYGYIHNEPGSTSVTVSGVSIVLLGEDIVNVAVPPGAAGPPNYTIPGNGELSITRYFTVSDSDANGALEARNEIFGVVEGTLTGVVTDSNGPVAGAEISVIGPAYISPGLHNSGPDVNVISAFRTDATGAYSGRLPVGNYTLRVNKAGRLASAQDNAPVTISNGGTATQNFTLPLPGNLSITVLDQDNSPIPAKVQLVGFDQNPDAATGQNSQSIAGGLLTAETGVFGDRKADPVSFGVAFTEYTRHQDGKFGAADNSLTTFEMTPGTYDLWVSHGPRYSAHTTQSVTVSEGENNLGTIVLTNIIPTPHYLHGDFHVHGIDSPDSEVLNSERIMTYLAANMDYFASADHGRRIDMRPVIDSIGAHDLLGASVGSENTTFDFGHINIYPAVHRPELISGGSIDWGNPAPPGEDFPSSGNYVLSPAEIFAAGRADTLGAGPEDITIQINHIEGHFGINGLRIDTGVEPPTSTALLDLNGETIYERKRINPASGNLFSDDFDALEIWISADGDLYQDEGTGHLFVENMGDWANMINQGIIRTAMSNSDTHQRRESALYIRNLITNPNGLTPADMHTDAGAIEATHWINEGRTVSTNGPILDVSITNQVGTVASLMPGDPGWKGAPLTVPAIGGTATLNLRVRAPDWAPFDRIRVYVNPTTYNTDLTQVDPPRYALCPAAIDMSVSPTPTAVLNGEAYYDESYSIPLTAELPLAADAWVFVTVSGTEGVSEPMFPIAPEALSASGNNSLADLRSNIGQEGIVALAYNNPLFITRDGNAVFDPPGVQTVPFDFACP